MISPLFHVKYKVLFCKLTHSLYFFYCTRCVRKLCTTQQALVNNFSPKWCLINLKNYPIKNKQICHYYIFLIKYQQIKLKKDKKKNSYQNINKQNIKSSKWQIVDWHHLTCYAMKKKKRQLIEWYLMYNIKHGGFRLLRQATPLEGVT